MTALDAFRSQLRPYNCDIRLGSDGQPKLVEYKEEPPTELVAEARQCRAALLVELLREKAGTLIDFIDGDTLLADRLARMPEYLETTDQLAEAQGRLFDSWRSAGFGIMWSPLVEEFILVGDGNRPPGSEGFAVYTWAEVEALKDSTPERVRAAHKVKKVFNGTVQRAARP